jgi:hypothetical protein
MTTGKLNFAYRNVKKKPLNYWRVVGVIRREHMMRFYMANLCAIKQLHLLSKIKGNIQLYLDK